MMPVGRPQFQVIVGATATERRLVTPAIVRALSGIPESVRDPADYGARVRARNVADE
jgi:hypothetical protein